MTSTCYGKNNCTNNCITVKNTFDPVKISSRTIQNTYSFLPLVKVHSLPVSKKREKAFVTWVLQSESKLLGKRQAPHAVRERAPDDSSGWMVVEREASWEE